MTTIGNVAVNTWRLVWRDAVTRIEVAGLALLTLAAALLASGSATSGDAAVQMYAIAYAVVPFALVPIIGRLNRHEADQPLPISGSRAPVLLGRFTGLVGVGLAMLWIVAAWGWGLITLITPLNPWDGAAWTIQFALFAMPSMVTVAGAALWLAAALSGRRRYVRPAVLITLAIFLAEYKITLVYRLLPHLPFFNPFPGLLEWGLALPPPLIAPPGVSGWLWVNRLLWGLVGVLFALLAVRQLNPGGAKWPRYARIMAILSAVGIAVASGFSNLNARHLSPAAARIETASTNFSCHSSRTTLLVNASSGRIRAQVSCVPNRAGTLHFAMNAGLTAVSITSGTNTIRSSHSGVIAGTALREWTLTRSEPHSPLSVVLTGHVLPYPSTLPYPPFDLNHVYSGIFAGSGHTYIADAERDLPTFLPKASPITLKMKGLAAGAVLTNATYQAQTKNWSSTLGQLAVSTGNLHKLKGGPNIWVVPHRGHIVQFLPYVGSIRQLEAWLPIPPDIKFVPSPVTTFSEWHPPFILYSEVHPFSRPSDPISGNPQPPTSYTATLTLSRLFWAAAAPGQNTPVHVVLTALMIFSHSNLANQTLLMQELRHHRVTDVGSLSKAQVDAVLEDWRKIRGRSRHAQRLWLRAVYRGRQH